VIRGVFAVSGQDLSDVLLVVMVVVMQMQM
jgi:hypothetical protein